MMREMERDMNQITLNRCAQYIMTYGFLGPDPKVARNASIWKNRQSGQTYRSIGDKHSISLERVRQICLKCDRMLRHPNSPIHPKNLAA
jgi:DNA-directed RNA polymerase sigma subunit (sigma70/sigma32)